MPDQGGNCMRCGACCATYPVLFAPEELDSRPGGWVPAALTETIYSRCVHMQGTAHSPRRCVALQGTVGEEVRCTIYGQRPSPCRDFAPEADTGQGDARCADARRLHGLPPLKGSYDAFPIG